MVVEAKLPFNPGDVLGGKYKVSRVIGEGGMGVVVEATHVQLDERVALKFLRPEMMSMPDVVARFDREARAAVKLKSEHVARVMDVGHTDAGIPYMVMEYLDGKDLGDTLSESGPLPIAQAVEYIIHACEGIGEAHARGIVHRDVKPENLFLVKRDDGWRSIKVLDFGISKAVLVGVDMTTSHTTNIMGSPHYMSPEQLRSTRTVDHRADVWSLGVVLFELLTGIMPFDETLEFTELVAEILETPHRKARAFRPEVPEALERVIDRALEKDRTRRYQNTAELAVALLPFAPKRARAMVERATSISKAAGLSDPAFQMPPSDLPPAPPEGTIDLGAIGSPRMPQMTPMMSPRDSRSTPSIGGSVETVAPDPMPRRWQRAAFAAGAVAVLAVGTIIAFAMRTTPATTTQAHTDEAPPTSAHSIAAITSAAIEAPPKPHLTRRVIVAEPREASVTVNGSPLSRATPWIEGSASALVHVEAPGFVARDLTVTFESEDPIVVQLDVASAQHVRPRATASASASASVTAPPPPTASPTDVGY